MIFGEPEILVFDNVDFESPSLDMEEWTDFAQEMGNDLDNVRVEDNPESYRKGLLTKNTGMYGSNPVYKSNVDKVAKSMSTIGGWMKDKNFDPKLRNAGAIEEHLQKLIGLSNSKHATAIQHGYALANPDEVGGKLGYPGSAAEAISRHIGKLHSDYYANSPETKSTPPIEQSEVIPQQLRSMGTAPVQSILREMPQHAARIARVLTKAGNALIERGPGLNPVNTAEGMPINRHTKQPFENYDPALKAKVAPKLAPHNRFKADEAIYRPLGANVVGLPGKGNRAFVTFEKQSGNPTAAKNIHIPWDKIEEFIKDHYVAQSPA